MKYRLGMLAEKRLKKRQDRKNDQFWWFGGNKLGPRPCWPAIRSARESPNTAAEAHFAMYPPLSRKVDLWYVEREQMWGFLDTCTPRMFETTEDWKPRTVHRTVNLT